MSFSMGVSSWAIIQSNPNSTWLTSSLNCLDPNPQVRCDFPTVTLEREKLGSWRDIELVELTASYDGLTWAPEVGGSRLITGFWFDNRVQPSPPTPQYHQELETPSTPLISGLYGDHLDSPLERNTGEIMLWTHDFSPYVYIVIGSDLKKHERQTKLKSCWPDFSNG